MARVKVETGWNSSAKGHPHVVSFPSFKLSSAEPWSNFQCFFNTGVAYRFERGRHEPHPEDQISDCIGGMAETKTRDQLILEVVSSEGCIHAMRELRALTF
jgi:hypothetical protein